MKYKEVDDVLPRNIENDLEVLLIKFSTLINDGVNFGTNLMKWDSEKQRAGDENMPPLLFLRNIIELSDAISILVKSSSIDSCKTILRSLIENIFSLEYLLETESEKRSISYIVWYIHRELTLYDKLTSTTQSGVQFKKELEKDRMIDDAKEYLDNPEIIQAKKSYEDLLNSPKYISIEAEYQLTSLKKKNPNWYSLFGGPTNIEQLAKHLKFNSIYEIKYRGYSGHVHATNVLEGKLIPNPDGSTSIVQIRYPLDAQSVTLTTATLLSMIFLSFCKARLPEKQADFQIWHLEYNDELKKLLSTNLINIIN